MFLALEEVTLHVFRKLKYNTGDRIIACMRMFGRVGKYFIKKVMPRGNQDGGVGRHTAPPCTTRTDRESNSKGD